MDNISHSSEVGVFPAQVKLFDPSLINKATVFSTLLFIFLVPWGDSVWDGLPRVAATIALGFAFIQLLVHGTHRNYTYFHFIAIMYFSWQIFSMIWSPELVRAEAIAKTITQLIFLTLLFALTIDNKSRLIAAYQVYVFACIVASGIVIDSFLQGVESGYLRYGIKNLTIDAVGVFLAISIPFEAYLAKYFKNIFLKTFNLIAIPFTFYAIFLTATRTAFIVGIVGLLYWVFTQRKSSFIIKLLIGIVMTAGLASIIMFAPKASVDRIFTTGESITEGTLNSRSIIWGGSIEQWKESPIVGVGLGGLGNALSREHINYADAHNSFIHLLAETGIVGLFLFLGVHIALLFYILHTPLDEKIFLLSLLMVIVVSQLATHLQTEKITWFIYSMIAIHSQMFAAKRRDH